MLNEGLKYESVSIPLTNQCQHVRKHHFVMDSSSCCIRLQLSDSESFAFPNNKRLFFGIFTWTETTHGFPH